MHSCAEAGHASVVQLLLEHCDADAEDEDSNTPAWLALSAGHADVAKQIVEEGEADVDADCEDGRTLLHLAVARNDVETATWLLDHGASHAVKDKFRNTALHAAAEHGSWEAGLLLLERGADARAAGKEANTPLHVVAANPSGAKKRIALVDALLDKGAKAGALNIQMCRPLDGIEGSSSEDAELRDLLMVRRASRFFSIVLLPSYFVFIRRMPKMLRSKKGWHVYHQHSGLCQRRAVWNAIYKFSVILPCMSLILSRHVC